MLKAVAAPNLNDEDDQAHLSLFVIYYGQHRIGVARARDPDQAQKLVEAHRMGDIEAERLRARAATKKRDPYEKSRIQETIGLSGFCYRRVIGD